MNSVKLRGVVDTIKKYNNDKGAGVRITISFWGFRKTFFSMSMINFWIF